MTGMSLMQLVFYFLILLLLVKPLGSYLAQVFEGKPCLVDFCCRPMEKGIYKLCRLKTDAEMNWKQYLSALLLFNCLGLLAAYGIQRLQAYLPLNPQAFPAVAPDLAFNTAISFASNTNWQAYSGELSLSYATQMLALTVQNFLSAATGLAIVMAFIRGLIRQETTNLGNFWVDLVRGTLYVLLPLSLILALALASQGVIQNFKPYQKISLLESSQAAELPMGPVASQIAIKQLGSNGGGFFNTNSAHPYENPTPLSNFLELLAILLIPTALCYTFGLMVKDKRQGFALLLTMFLLFIPFMLVGLISEQAGNPALTRMNIDPVAESSHYPGGNMEGKESRFGITSSALWAAATTATSNGSVNAMHDSFTPLGGLVLLWFMHLGEVVFGGLGSGLAGLLILVIITVFIAGLMIGRTPEYLGKKIEPYEMKMASFSVLLMPLLVLFLTAWAAINPSATSSLTNPTAHGFSEILYAFTSMGNNNGSAFAGLKSNTPFYNLLGGLEMLVIRYWLAIPILALAGALARKKIIPTTSGTLATHTPLFIILLLSVTLILGALTFFPALALGPIVEYLTLGGGYGH